MLLLWLLLIKYVISVESMHLNLYESPCPEIFEYFQDNRGELSGKILVRSTNEPEITLKVELSVGNSVQGYNGKIILDYSKEKIINDILSSRPLLYKVEFPVWRRFPPRITKILLNGRLICSGQPLNIKAVPVLTTITLQHVLKINVTSGLFPLNPSVVSSPTSNNFDFYNNPGGNPQFVTENVDNSPRIDYFNENGPKKDYPNNPFFYLTTTSTNGYADQNPPKDLNLNQIITFTAPTTTEIPQRSTENNNNNNFNVDIRTDDIADVCGKSLATNYLISYGHPIERGHHPWLAALYVIQNLGLVFICGGNLISNKHVLTAAHCLRRNGRNIRTDDLLVILGKHNIQQWVDNESLMVYAEQITIHKDYRELFADADIGMITLTKKIEFKTFIRPICLWSEESNLNRIVGQMGIVAGWGKDENGVQTSAEAKQVVLPIVDSEVCRKSQETLQEVVTERTFCAGFRNGSGPCNGDSGGGFIMQRGGRWTLRGLVSLSLFDTSKVCDLSQYLVFTDVSQFTDWIKSFLK
ncbi:serine protease gd-like [Onthophagus taurus]|uniref:serine protease gd-like n=1 Tax=Onthophagus taurus TaxID=166361 RepID=UPI0039BDE226